MWARKKARDRNEKSRKSTGREIFIEILIIFQIKKLFFSKSCGRKKIIQKKIFALKKRDERMK